MQSRVGTLNSKFELENRTKLNPNYPNGWFIRVSRFTFGLDNFIIYNLCLVSVPMVYNPK
jgi:hypothetical protein